MVPPMKRTLRALACLPLLAVAACGSSDSGDNSKSEASKPTKVSKPTKAPYDGAAYAAKVNAEMKANLMHPIPKSCQITKAVTWHCFFEKYESPAKGTIKIVMSFPGDFSRDEQKDLGETARLHTFNLAGYTLEDLDTVYSYGDGVDTGTTYRRDVPLLNR